MRAQGENCKAAPESAFGKWMPIPLPPKGGSPLVIFFMEARDIIEEMAADDAVTGYYPYDRWDCITDLVFRDNFGGLLT